LPDVRNSGRPLTPTSQTQNSSERSSERQRELLEERQRRASRKIPPEIAFIESLSIEDKVSGSLIPFTLWPFQREAVSTLNDADRVFALKARQLGITWLVLAHLLYLGAFWGNRLFLIASQSGSDAIDALHRIRILYNSLPVPPVALIKDNTEEIAFANGSRFESMKATKRAGRSKAAYAGFADEYAFWDWPEDQLTALDSACERLYAVTTGNGPGDLAHTIWEQAERQEGRWKTLFIPWHAHPGRDAEWYRLNVTEAPEPRLATREHASTPEQAFAAPGGSYFERFSREHNVRKVEPQPGWQAWRGVDFGFRHPACLWVQKAPSGQLFVVAEYAPERKITEEFRDGIVAMDKKLGVSPKASYCDPSGKSANVQTAESEFEVFKRARLNPRGQPSGVRDGCMRIMNLLADPDLPLIVSEDCPELIRCLTQVKPDKSRPDLYDQREDCPYQHLLDALRYLLVNVRLGSSGGAVAYTDYGSR
jgi:hypothetical protein